MHLPGAIRWCISLTLVFGSSAHAWAIPGDTHKTSPAPTPSPSSQFNYTDLALWPNSIQPSNYERYITFLAVGNRSYVCSTNASAPSPFQFVSFDYNMFDIDAAGKPQGPSRGKHVVLLEKDAQGGNSVFYTATKTFTYWVGKSLKFAPDPAANSDEDLTLELALRTEASEPKIEAGKYDMGIAVYATRFGARGGNPVGKCTGPVDVWSEVYYSMWKQIA